MRISDWGSDVCSSDLEQAAETAARHFAGQDHLVMLMVDLAPFGDALKWEESRGGALFPHLYGELPLSAVAGKVILRLDKHGRHFFPAGFCTPGAMQDRKRAVYRKSVYVRVDLVGR